MRTWIVNPYGTLPGEGWREYRACMLARAFERAGHEVVWWISNVDHRSKRLRAADWQDIAYSDRIKFRVVPTTTYQRNISLERIRYETRFAKAFAARGANEIRPDIICVTEPALFYGQSALQLARRFSSRLIIDVMDLWPELFKIALPRLLAPFHRLVFLPLYRRRRYLLSHASAIVSVSEDYRQLTNRVAPHVPSHVAYLGVDVAAFRQAMTSDSFGIEHLRLPAKQPHDRWTVVSGTLGDGYDLSTVTEAAARCSTQNPHCKFIFAGDGPQRGLVERLCNSMPDSCFYLGRIPIDELTRVYGLCDVGVCSYVRSSTVSMPTKFFDYVAAGLAVVNSLDSEISTYVQQGIGVNYRPGSVESLCNALRECVSAGTRLDDMKRASWSLAPKFDSDTQHDSMVSFIARSVS